MRRRRTTKSTEKVNVSSTASSNQVTPSKSNKSANNWPTPICADIKVNTPISSQQKNNEKSLLEKCPCNKKVVPEADCHIECSQCKQWWHSHCANLSPKQAKSYCGHKIFYSCIFCTAKNLNWDNNILQRINNIADQATVKAKDPISVETQLQQQCPKEHIIIVDKVGDSPKNSAEVKSKLKKSGNNIPINYTYTLPKGGIAIHTDAENKDKLAKAINKTFPNSIQHQPLIKQQRQKVIVRGIRPHISEEDLKIYLNTSLRSKVNIHRFHSKTTGRPFPIISVETDITTASTLLTKGILIFGKLYKCTTYIKPAVRCYNCQSYGHISRNCSKVHICNNCGQSDCTTECNKPAKCHNCSGNHQASSNLCPTYLDKKLQLQDHFHHVYNKDSATKYRVPKNL